MCGWDLENWGGGKIYTEKGLPREKRKTTNVRTGAQIVGENRAGPVAACGEAKQIFSGSRATLHNAPGGLAAYKYTTG